MKIALVDDDKQQLDLVSRYLQGEGMMVLTCHGPFGATHAIKEFGADVAVVDLDMTLEGNHLARVIRQKLPNVKVLLYSASDEIRIMLAARDSGAHGWLSKSEKLSALRSKILSLV